MAKPKLTQPITREMIDAAVAEVIKQKFWENEAKRTVALAKKFGLGVRHSARPHVARHGINAH